jgi:hypothetical protein
MITEIASGVKMSLHDSVGFSVQAGVLPQVDLVSGLLYFGFRILDCGFKGKNLKAKGFSISDFGFWISD